MAAVLVFAFSGLIIAAPLQLDPTFGSGGTVVALQPVSSYDKSSVSVCTNGTFYTTTYSAISPFGSVISRYLANGTLDAGFPGITFPAQSIVGVACSNNGGVLALDLDYLSPVPKLTVRHYRPNGTADPAYVMAPTAVVPSLFRLPRLFVKDANDGIVLVGESASGSPTSLYAIRYTPTGVFDTSFGLRVVSPSSGGEIGVSDVALDSAGRILILSHQFDLTFSPPTPTIQSNWVSAVTRLLPSGAVDSSYGVNGSYLDGPYGPFPLGSGGVGYSNLGVDLSGAAYMINSSCPTSRIRKLSPSGSVDTTFGVGGNLTFGASLFCARSATVGADGALYVAGFTGGLYPSRHDGTVIKLATANGAIDSSFGQNGLLQLLNTPLGSEFNALAFTPSGKLLTWGFQTYVVSNVSAPVYPLLAQFGTTTPTNVPTLSVSALALLALLLAAGATFTGVARRSKEENN